MGARASIIRRRIHRQLFVEELERRIAPAAGGLDYTFDFDGKVATDFGFGGDWVSALAIQSDGRIVAAGHAWNGTDSDFALARYNADGSLDTSFGSGGKVTTDFASRYEYGYAVAIQSDGRIVVAGRTWNGSDYDFALARYNIDGSLDTSFDGDGKVTTDFAFAYDEAYAVAIQSDGRIVVAGYTFAAGDRDFALARYNGDGSLDTSFDGDGKVTTDFPGDWDFGRAVAIQSDGKIVVAGYSYNGINYDFALARYDSDGSLDTTFDGDGKVTSDFDGFGDLAYAVAIQSDGKIVAAGYSANGSNYDFALSRYNSDGSLDTSFDGDGKITSAFGSGFDAANAVAIQSDGKILVAGYAYVDSNYGRDFALARYWASDIVYCQDFSSGKPSDNWTYYSSTGGGRIEVVDGALRMVSDGTMNLNEAILGLNLAGLSNITLQFDHRDSLDEPNALPDKGAYWSGEHQNGDGIAISDDGGATWSTVLSLGRDKTWRSYAINLDEAIAAAGMSFTANFQIKFQQYDNHWWGLDGREFDNIVVCSSGFAPIDYSQDFSSGKPNGADGWQYYSSMAGGRIEVVNGALRMESDGTNNLNEAILSLNLSGQSNVQLQFKHRDSSDEPNAMPTGIWSGHAAGDDVAISDDGGANWYSIVSLGRNTSWTTYTIDLDAMIAAAGMSYTATFQIKFQQYDNHWWGLDGREFDDISVTAA